MGNYATRVNAKTTIFPLTPGTRIILNGTYNIEDHNRTKLIIYSGDTNSNLKLFENSISNSGNISVRSQLGPVTVVFLVDSDSPNSGFELIISICDVCPPIPQMNVNVLTDSTTLITWNSSTVSQDWLLEYYEDCAFPISFWNPFYQLNDTSILLTNLTHCKNYGARLFTPCDTTENACDRVF